MNTNPYNPQMPLYGQQNYYNNFQQHQYVQGLEKSSPCK